MCAWPWVLKGLTLRDRLNACVSVVAPWFATHSFCEGQRALQVLFMDPSGVAWLSQRENESMKQHVHTSPTSKMFSNIWIYMSTHLGFILSLKSITSSP